MTPFPASDPASLDADFAALLGGNVSASATPARSQSQAAPGYQLVNVPGVGTLRFPQNMSQPDMAAAIQRNFPHIHGPATGGPMDRLDPDFAALASSAPTAYDPTEGNSFLQNALIGSGKQFTDLGLGAQQLAADIASSISPQRFGSWKQSLQQQAAEKRALDAPIMKTAGGKVGDITDAARRYLAASGVPSLAVTSRTYPAPPSPMTRLTEYSSKAVFNFFGCAMCGCQGHWHQIAQRASGVMGILS